MKYQTNCAGYFIYQLSNPRLLRIAAGAVFYLKFGFHITAATAKPSRCAFKNLLHFQKPWFGQELEGGRLMRALDEIQMGEHSQSELIPTACKECDNEHAFCMQV